MRMHYGFLAIFLLLLSCKPEGIYNIANPVTEEYLLQYLLTRSGDAPKRNFRYIFLSEATAPNFQGATGGDNLCNNSALKPADGGVFKAMVADNGSGRYEGGADWVFAANTEYRRSDGTVILTTLTAGVLPANLNAGIIDGTAGGLFTGLDANGQIPLPTLTTCSAAGIDWNDTSAVTNAYAGYSYATTKSLLLYNNKGGGNCSTLVLPLACIEQ